MNVLGLSETWMLCQPQYHHHLLVSSSLRERNNTLVLLLSTILVCLIAQYEKKHTLFYCIFSFCRFQLIQLCKQLFFCCHFGKDNLEKKSLQKSSQSVSLPDGTSNEEKEHNGPWTDSCSFLSSALDARC